MKDKKYKDFSFDQLIELINELGDERDEFRQALESIAFSHCGNEFAKNRAARALGIRGPF